MASENPKYTSVIPEGNIQAQFGGWNGEPKRDPEYTMRAYFIDPYWYVITTDGTHRAISDDNIETLRDLIWCVGEQVRILATPPYGNLELEVESE